MTAEELTQTTTGYDFNPDIRRRMVMTKRGTAVYAMCTLLAISALIFNTLRDRARLQRLEGVAQRLEGRLSTVEKHGDAQRAYKAWLVEKKNWDLRWKIEEKLRLERGD